MGYYLLDHPPASPQYRDPRRERLSGVVVVHTTEGIMDNVGPDTGAENVAAFIARRSDPGSYHVLCDSDSDIDLIWDGAESFQVAVNGHNRHAWGICAATSVHLWFTDPEWDKKTIDRMGQKIYDFWEK